MKKDTDKNKGTKVGTVLVIAFLVLYLPSLWNWIYGTEISTDIIREGVIENSINTEAFIIRDEKIVTSPFDGKYIAEVGEGEKVPANYRVATVLKKAAVNLLDELEDKNKSILEIQNEDRKALNVFHEDAEKIDNRIKDKIGMLVEEINKNNLTSYEEIKLQIDELNAKKIAIIGGNNSNNAFLNQLIKERDRLQEQVNLNTRDVIIDEPGIVSYTIDNYESVLGPKAIEELTPSFLDNIKISDSITRNNNNVSAGKPFARVIKGIEYYIVVALDAQNAESINIGDKLSIRINDIGKKLEMCTVYYKSEEINKKYIIAIKADRYMNETSDIRKINIDLIKEFHQGLIVPVKSLKNMDHKNQKANIIMVEANCAVTRKVDIIGCDDDFAIISDAENTNKKYVGLYDTYVINPVNVEEGQIIN